MHSIGADRVVNLVNIGFFFLDRRAAVFYVFSGIDTATEVFYSRVAEVSSRLRFGLFESVRACTSSVAACKL